MGTKIHERLFYARDTVSPTGFVRSWIARLLSE